MDANYEQRLRLTFRKDGPARYISHLDLARTLERSLNRAKIPVAYTQGFNRRPRMQMATALPLGYTSSHELADIMLTEPMEPEAARAQMMVRMAPGIDVYQAVEVPVNAPSLQAATLESSYIATLLDPVDVAALQQQVAELMAAPTLLRVKERDKKMREYDLRPLIFDLSASQTETGAAQIQMRLCLKPSETGRPDEVLLALGFDPLDAHVHRTQIVLDETR
jgi:radical SAM-linked protein